MSFFLATSSIISYRNGVQIYGPNGTTGPAQVVQIDDDKPTIEGNVGGVPVVSKTMYAAPAGDYLQGDQVVITQISGHGSALPQDTVFWVRRANYEGGALPATVVGLVGGMRTNTAVDVYRGMSKIITALPVWYALPGPERFTADGGALAGTLYVPDPTQDVRFNDILVFNLGLGLTTQDQQVQYQAGAVLHAPAPVPHLRIDISTTLGGFALLP